MLELVAPAPAVWGGNSLLVVEFADMPTSGLMLDIDGVVIDVESTWFAASHAEDEHYSLAFDAAAWLAGPGGSNEPGRSPYADLAARWARLRSGTSILSFAIVYMQVPG